MNDLIPLEYYTPVYYNSLFILIIVTLFHTFALSGRDVKSYAFNRIFSYFVLFSVILYMGLRPISGWIFGDMSTYAATFNRYAEGGSIVSSSDFVFHYFMKICSSVMSVGMFFLTCAFLYLIPPFLAFKKWFPNHYFFALLVFITSFSFWAYGTNGIRNGIASSFLIFAISIQHRKFFMILFILLSVSFHKSMLLPSVAFIFTLFYKNTKMYFILWLFAIPLSLLFAGFWENFFAGLGFADDRLSYLIEGNVNEDNFSSTGFRWDFLLYSFTAVFAGYYYIFKKGFNDPLYSQILQVYLFANAFWILIIRATFSNRFAFLSWFLISTVIIYPLLKRIFLKNQFSKIGIIILFYFIFTYFMNVIIA